MYIYIASRYQNRHEKKFKELVRLLKGAGHKIVSRWIDNPEDDGNHMPCSYLSASAVMDKEDVWDCDVLLVWHYNAEGATGGMFWEMGFATGRNKAIILMNPEEEPIKMIFGLLPEVIHTRTVQDTLKALVRLEEEDEQ